MTRLADLSLNHPVMVCNHVHAQTRDVLAVAIDEERRVSLDCGDEEHGEGDWHLSTWGQMKATDPGLMTAPALTPMEFGQRAFRGGPWWLDRFSD